MISKKIYCLAAMATVFLLQACYSMYQQKTSDMNSQKKSLLIEQTEMAAWRDLIDAATDSFKKAKGLRYEYIGRGLAINFQKEPIPLFNRVIGLGLEEPLSQEVIDSIKSFYSQKEKYIVHYSSPMQPFQSDSLLKQNGFYLAGTWERIVRDNRSLNYHQDPIEVMQVDSSLKEKWVKFLIDTYGFDFYEWPEAFALRKGWKHYIAVRGEKIVACRSFFMTENKTVFSGVDAPVPGVMTTDHAPDFAIWRRAIDDGLKDGARLFVSDIEMPDKEKNKESYEGFKQLGFKIPYTRYHYRLNK